MVVDVIDLAQAREERRGGVVFVGGLFGAKEVATGMFAQNGANDDWPGKEVGGVLLQ